MSKIHSVVAALVIALVAVASFVVSYLKIVLYIKLIL